MNMTSQRDDWVYAPYGLYVLFFIELKSRRVHLVGCTENPNGAWVAQQARNLVWSLTERASPLRFLIHDRDSKLTAAFDEIFRSEGISIIRTPVRAPKPNAFAERFVGTVRRECLDGMLIFGRRQLERTSTPTSSTTTAIDRIEALASSRRGRHHSCGLQLPSSPIESGDGIDWEA